MCIFDILWMKGFLKTATDSLGDNASIHQLQPFLPGQRQDRCSQQTGSRQWLWHQQLLHRYQIPQSLAHKAECWRLCPCLGRQEKRGGRKISCSTSRKRLTGGHWVRKLINFHRKKKSEEKWFKVWQPLCMQGNTEQTTVFNNSFGTIDHNCRGCVRNSGVVLITGRGPTQHSWVMRLQRIPTLKMPCSPKINEATSWWLLLSWC